MLFSFINYAFLGCTAVYRRQLNEIQPNDKIRNAITPSRDKIRFDYKNGYHYMLEAPGIAGITESGFWAVIQMKYIKEIRSTSPKIIKSKKELRNQKIIELITNDNTLVKFDSAGGIYDNSDEIVEGLNQHGYEESYKMNSIMGCRITPPGIISKDHLFLMKDQFIAEVVTSEEKLITFDEQGGMYVEASNVLVGFTKEGSLIRLNQNQIDFVYVKHPVPVATFIMGSLLGSFLGAVLIYYYLIIPSQGGD